jgi:hypothetical protein
MTSCFTCTSLFSLSKEVKVANMIANIIAFSPPTRASYSISEESKTDERGACYKKVNFHHMEYDEIEYPWIEKQCYQIQKCTTKKRLIVMHIKNTSVPKENKFNIIFSHGNACDLGVIYPFLVDLSTQLKADIISYDYSGYGRSEGSPSERDLYTDIEQVMDFVTISLRIKQESIVL